MSYSPGFSPKATWSFSSSPLSREVLGSSAETLSQIVFSPSSNLFHATAPSFSPNPAQVSCQGDLGTSHGCWCSALEGPTGSKPNYSHISVSPLVLSSSMWNLNIHLAISSEAQQSPNSLHSTYSDHPCTHPNWFFKPASIHHSTALAQDTKLQGASKDVPRPAGPA